MNQLKDLQEQIKNQVIGQDEAIDIITIVLFKHFLKLHSHNEDNAFFKIDEFKDFIDVPSTVLIYGDTGCGKTYIMKTIAKLIDMPFIEINCKSIVQEGWSGKSFIQLVEESLKDDQTGYGILFLDEFDKMLIENNSDHGNISNHLQASLLKYIEGLSTAKIDFRKYMIVFAGAFNNLLTIDEKNIGFNKIQKSNSNKELSESLIKFGMMPELVGRIYHYVKINPLHRLHFFKILHHSSFNYNYWKKMFSKFNLEFNITNEDKLLENAVKLKLGARGLIQLIEEEATIQLNQNINKLIL